MNIIDFQLMKQQQQKISMVTCYDYWSAKIIAHPNTHIDCILVGDSLGMVMHGYDTTLPATTELMALHIRAVALGAANKFIIADMPFLSYRKGIKEAMNVVQQLLVAGAHAIKLEGTHGHERLIKHIVQSGVPVIGHLGLMPQSIRQYGGFRVQGKQEEAANKVLLQAKQLEDAGCFAVVLECIPAQLARTITEQLTIPTIGIGAGSHVDGQVMVLHDLIGVDPTFKPKFVKHFCNSFNLIQTALNQYDEQVKQQKFPTENHWYS